MTVHSKQDAVVEVLATIVAYVVVTAIQTLCLMFAVNTLYAPVWPYDFGHILAVAFILDLPRLVWIRVTK
jgi:hypothetical protein